MRIYDDCTALGRLRSSAVTALAAGIMLTTGSGSWAQNGPEFDDTWVRIEINATDGDAGLHGMVDGDSWERVVVKDPDGEKIYVVKGKNNTVIQGLTENFFESSEPPCDEQSLEEFLALFPEGEYRFRGTNRDGERLRTEWDLTYALPGAPENLAPTGGGIDASAGVTISWTPGDTLGNCPPGAADIEPPGDVELFGWQVVVAREVPEPLLEFVAELPPAQTSVSLPPEILAQNSIYKFEIVAIEGIDDDGETLRGNQVLSEAIFCTLGVDPCELN